MAKKDEKEQVPEEGATEQPTEPPFEEVAEENESATGEPEEELTEEELRRIIEEQLERVTVGQMVQQMMVTLASIGYQKMGLPEEVNLKYRDLDQARLAVDSLEGLLRASGGKMPDDQLEPFRGTLSNLKLNYVSISAKLKGGADTGATGAGTEGATEGTSAEGENATTPEVTEEPEAG